jgi:hypothetical protein
MKAFQLTGDIDENHQLRAEVPGDFPTGAVQLIVLVPEEDDAGIAWEHGIAKEWARELNNPQEDIYTLNDGQPLNAPR